MKTDQELKQDVIAELGWEPAVNASQIGVSQLTLRLAASRRPTLPYVTRKFTRPSHAVLGRAPSP